MTTATVDRAQSGSVNMLIGGRWETSHSTRYGPVFNPSTGRVIATVPFCRTNDVEKAVQAAAAALPAWAETPVVERARVMFRFREKLTSHAEELACLVTREHGKTLAESRVGPSRSRGCRIRLRYTQPDHGPVDCQHRPAGRLRNAPPSGRCVRGHHSV